MAFTPRRLMRGASGAGGYQISRSLRFNSADAANLTRTHTTPTNRRTFTISLWIKRTSLGAGQIANGNVEASGNGLLIEWLSGDELYLYDVSAGPGGFQIYSTAKYRDPSAWYHLVFAFDTTQATNTNRIKVYINGVQQDLSTWQLGGGASRYPSQNADMFWNYNVNPTRIGGTTGYSPLNGYITDFYNIDGQQLDSSYFGETDASTGVWKPKAYSGSYGTNGFKLNFSDNSGATATTLGRDYSGNNNNFTPNNFSVTAGAGNDSLVDSPTLYGTDTGVGGTVRGNYATMNPLKNVGGPNILKNGNLDLTTSAYSWGTTFATMGMSTGKWYWECVRTDNTYGPAPGIATEELTNGDSTTTGSVSWSNNGNIYNEGSGSIIAPTYTQNDILRLAYDADAGTLQVAVNGGVFTTVATGKAGRTWFPTLKAYGASDAISINFGQRPFTYTAPSGFKVLCTQNLPTPTIGATTATQAGKYFNTVLYTGNGSTLSVTGVGFQPDWVWAKDRGLTASHRLVDAVRGVTKSLFSNLTDAETTESGLTAFNSDGFTVGSAIGMNYNTEPFVAWNWKAGSSTVTNTAGSLTSQVNANPTAGFSILTYTGNAAAEQTIGHGLGAVPKMIIVKGRTGGNWPVYHSSVGRDQYAFLNDTAAVNTVTGYWGSSGPTTTTFGVVGGGYGNNSGTAVAYCFAEVPGYSSIGYYIGNGSANGPFIYTGFRPAFILVKASSGGNAATANWLILDNVRDTYNETSSKLAPNLSTAENGGTIGTAAQNNYDFLSNGFKARTTNGSSNESGTTFIYMAFASTPFKYSLAR